jgi:TonB family protein
MNVPMVAGVLIGLVGGVGAYADGQASPQPDAAIIRVWDIVTKKSELDAAKLRALGLDPSRVKLPKVKRQGQPHYPTHLYEDGRQASVAMEFQIDTAGIPQDFKVTQSGGKDFDAAAQDAVRQWRYTPFMVDGKPQPIILRAIIEFRLQYR